MKSVENSTDEFADIENELFGVGSQGAVTGTLEICDTGPVQEWNVVPRLQSRATTKKQ